MVARYLIYPYYNNLARDCNIVQKLLRTRRGRMVTQLISTKLAPAKHLNISMRRAVELLLLR